MKPWFGRVFSRPGLCAKLIAVVVVVMAEVVAKLSNAGDMHADFNDTVPATADKYVEPSLSLSRDGSDF
jgi:hypothetical protein